MIDSIRKWIVVLSTSIDVTQRLQILSVYHPALILLQQIVVVLDKIWFRGESAHGVSEDLLVDHSLHILPILLKQVHNWL